MPVSRSVESRRTVLVGGAIAAVAALFGRANTANAADGDPLVLGTTNIQSDNNSTQIADSGNVWQIDIGNNSTGAVFKVDADAGPICIEGRTGGSGVAVHAMSNGATGLLADGGGVAIEAHGEVQFSTAGLATIPQGKSSITVTPGVPITTSSKVLATLQSGGGTFKRVGRNPTSNTITLYLSGNATSAVIVAYFIIS